MSWCADLGDRDAEALAQLRLHATAAPLACAFRLAGLGEVQVDLAAARRTRVTLTPRSAASGELALDLPRLVDLEDVALLDVLEVREHDAALEARRDLAHVVVEAAQRVDRRRRR